MATDPSELEHPNSPAPAQAEASSTLRYISRCHKMAVKVLQQVKHDHIETTPPRSGPLFTVSQAAELVGRTASSIRMAETEGRLPHHDRDDMGRRKGYTLAELAHMREVFETKPWRKPGDPTAIIACQNFKGGVGKSTISVHTAQYLAMRGYRVLLVDADAQASTTMMFGYIPDQDLQEDDSIYPILRAEKKVSLKSLIRKTHYHGLDLIPANLKLYNAEYELAAAIRDYGFSVLGTLGSELAKISDDYDVIIMDPPPALGMVSLSVLYAANALLIPMPPSIVDFASTASFLGMLEETMQFLTDAAMVPEYGFIQMLVSKNDTTIGAQSDLLQMAKMVFGRTIMASELKTSAEFHNASSRLQSVFDLPGSTTNHAVRQRCLKQLNAVGSETETLIRGLWPSTHEEERG